MIHEAIAKRYAKAVTELLGENDLEIFSSDLKKVSTLFSNKKFIDIIYSPDVAKQEKENIILESLEQASQSFINLVKLLSEKDRLEIIPAISKEISNKISLNNNIYVGKLISGFAVNEQEIADLELKLSEKFNSTIKLENEVKKFSGIKVELDELGVEVSFSLDRLKSQISEYILKAI